MDGAMSGLVCQPMRPEEAAPVFPLIREAIPGITPRTWQAFARRVANPRRAGREGIIVAHRPTRPLPCGLFVYRRDRDLAHGPVLIAEHFVALDVLDPEPVMRALVDELDVLATRLGCVAIRSSVLDRVSPLAERLEAAGHRALGGVLWKDVAGGRAPDF